MSHYKYHVFFCCNQRDEGKICCNNSGASEAIAYASERIAQLGLRGKGKGRISKAGYMDRCGEGPVIVVYPQGIWYAYADIGDIEEIIQEHLVNGRVVERLKI